MNPLDCHYPGAAQTCGDGCKDAAIAHCDGAGMCTAATACPGNFACADSTNCKSTCAGDTDCAGGYTCKAGACSPAPTAKCSADGTASVPVDTSKTPVQCAPYRCDEATGGCHASCATTSQCAAGATCDPSTTPPRCVPTAAPPPAEEANGGCAYADTRAGAAWGWLGLAVLSLIAHQRRERAPVSRQ